ncbi:MAG: 3-deoxy-D-manno-octulosonic acid transferase [Paracoccaceae bacterium]
MSNPLNLGPLSRRASDMAGTSEAPVTTGSLLWIHATSDLRLRVLCDVGEQLVAQRDALDIMTTYDPALMTAPGNLPEVYGQPIALPVTGGSHGRNLINNRKPDLCLWSGGHVNPGLIRYAHDAGTRLVLVDADTEGVQERRRRWFSDPVQNAMSRFSRAFANSAPAADLLRRGGIPVERIDVTQPLRPVPTPPECPDEEVAEVTQELAGRPVWLATFAHPDEFGFVVAAQRNAVRHSHRLLLVIYVEDRSYIDDLLALLEGVTLRHCLWHLGDPIDDQMQVLVTEDPEDLGLWYRIAPQTFLGHSLVAGQGGRCPLDAAALGSAVLHGPNIGAHSDAYFRLTSAGAAQLVTDGNALGGQVARLIAPDIAAEMALAGWDVATEGAELTERVIKLSHDLLDESEADHART